MRGLLLCVCVFAKRRLIGVCIYVPTQVCPGLHAFVEATLHVISCINIGAFPFR